VSAPAAPEPDPFDDELEALLDDVWRRHRTDLLARAAVLTDHLSDALAGRPSWGLAGAEAHRLTGALGSLGFDELARVSGELERGAATAVPDEQLVHRARGITAALEQAEQRPGT
jgi:HPt (histidine-containing phosphotransfer) domain-containing protein